MELAVTRHSESTPFVRLGLALAVGALLGAGGASLAGGLGHQPATRAPQVQPVQAPAPHAVEPPRPGPDHRELQPAQAPGEPVDITTLPAVW
jgi:hypothetical protein